MAKKPDVPCAGCGKLIWSSRSSRPPGESACHPCRRANPGRWPRRTTKPRRPIPTVDSQCVVCGAEFVAKATNRQGYPGGYFRKTCSERCHRYYANKAQPRCECVGSCSEECREDRRQAVNQRKNLRRRAGGYVVMSIRQLGERDGWRCHLCRRKVNQKLRGPHPMSASRDHLIPVADGGSNDDWNLALAHWICNVRRGTGGEVQPTLFAATCEVGPRRSRRPVRTWMPCGHRSSTPAVPCVKCRSAEKSDKLRSRGKQAALMRAEGAKWQDISDRLGFSGTGAAFNAARAFGDPEVVSRIGSRWPTMSRPVGPCDTPG
jgi:hypothetical protein